MSINQSPKVPPTLYQLVGKDGGSFQAAHTDTLWVDDKNAFSAPTSGNKIAAFTTGEAYFADLIKEFDAATSEICMAGWQVNWDAMLAPGVRLYDVFLRAAKRGVDIYVMPWNDTEPVQTYDDQTKVVLESINDLKPRDGTKFGKVKVELCPAFVEHNGGYYSHHQKQVVVDRKIAYVGGIDVAYGRFDDDTYDLRPDAKSRQGLNRYNPGIPRLLDISSTPYVDPDLMSGMVDRSRTFDGKKVDEAKATKEARKIAAGSWQVPYADAGMAGIIFNSPRISANSTAPYTLDPARQPRMPWQDVHSRIEGPAVSHLLRNFVARWNAISDITLPPAPAPGAYPKLGNAQIQVLRSAAMEQCAKERGSKNSAKTQTDIHQAMIKLIEKSRHFIYIENQFFVSDFGEVDGVGEKLSNAAQFIKNGANGLGAVGQFAVRRASGSWWSELDRLPQNLILKTLLDRLRKVIVDDAAEPNFHVYITVPVHPEGSIYNAAIAVQVFFTMQSLVFGSNSLINGIRRLIKARKLKEREDPTYERVIRDQDNTEYKSVSIEECYQYVTLMNLRNWAKLGNRYVTEQIYVHSKLMIVDDRFAIMGSANINDRSLLGDRDSELAILVADEDSTRCDINGDGCPQPVRTFAHELRKNVWKKIFGVGIPGREPEGIATAIDAPGSPASRKAIAELITKNAGIYEEAFDYIPRNKSNYEKAAGSIMPTWTGDPGAKFKGKLAASLPFQEEFWNPSAKYSQASGIAGVRGFACALPVKWTTGENIWIKFPTALIVKRKEGADQPATPTEPNNDVRVASNGIQTDGLVKL
ncbi:phospholipase D-like domain-containing protein [Pseudoduganella sp. HUAS MS19]